MKKQMHYTGTIWRPPYEADSLLLEVTAGCTYHRCKFCTLYDDLPFRFRLSPMEDVEADLLEAQTLFYGPQAKAARRLAGREAHRIRRVYLTGANPFALAADKLLDIAQRIHTSLPDVETIGCFSRVTDVTRKTPGELDRLRESGYDGLTIGVETGDDRALAFMNKGYAAEEIITQCARLDEAGIRYHFFYLAGICGAGRGVEGARNSARVFHHTHPQIIGSSMLTVFPQSELHREIERGRWQQEPELEKVEELKTLISQLDIPVYFASLGASNAIFVQGHLPQDRARMLARLDEAARTLGEERLEAYRKNLRHL